MSNRLYGELGRVGSVTDVHSALVVGQVVDAVGDDLAYSPSPGSLTSWTTTRSGEPAGQYPLGAPVGESADDLLLLGVHTDHGLALRDEGSGGVIQIAKLRVPAGVLSPSVTVALARRE